MKIIDEKGKFFGKLNIIDFLAILVLVVALVVAAVQFAGKGAPGGSQNPPGGTGHLTYTVLVGAINEEVYEEVNRQMDLGASQIQLMASGDMLSAYITKVEAAPHVNMVFDEQSNLHYVEEYGPTRRMDLTFTIEADNVDTLLNKVGTQEVRVGRTHIVKTLNFEFNNGIVTTCVWAQ